MYGVQTFTHMKDIIHSAGKVVFPGVFIFYRPEGPLDIV